jgi:hypothetical protein
MESKTPGRIKHPYFLIYLAIFCLSLYLPANADQKRAILIVSDRRNVRMSEKENQLVKNVQTLRNEYGFDKTNLPILVYDYSRSDVKSYVNSLGIDLQDLPCLAAVGINIRTRGTTQEEIPTRVILKIAQPVDPEKSVRMVLGHLRPAAVSSVGTIVVTSDPTDAKVWFGKIYKGKTPLTITDAPPGKHILTFVKEGYEKTRREITLEKGKSVTCAVTMLSDSGMMAITSKPAGSKVYVDGVYLGITPLEIKQVAPGKRRVVILSNDSKWEKEVSIERGKKLTLDAEILPKATPRPLEPPVAAVPKMEGPPPGSTGDVREAFLPQGAHNGVFQVFISHVEEVEKIKNYYTPMPGRKFIILYITQQNISDELQIYPGEFNLFDEMNSQYTPLDRLSNFWATMLRPGGLRLGYLVFEIPVTSRPSRIVLHGNNIIPLTINLNM